MDDDMSEIWATALHNYVVEGGWREVQNFIDTKAALFGSDVGAVEGEFGEGEFAIFEEFRNLASRTLDTLLTELGCSSSADESRLAVWLEQQAAKPAAGPREAMAKALLADLVSVDDFRGFVRMMRRRNDELQALDVATDDWELQQAMAHSILSARQAGRLATQDEAYVGWAQALVNVANAETSVWHDDPARASALYRDLAVHQLKVELAVAHRTVFEERAARAEAGRAAVADAGGSHDARVTATLARCDDLQRDAAASRGACVRDATVCDANLEMAYLLVKGLLSKRQDLAQHAEPIYDALHAQDYPEGPPLDSEQAGYDEDDESNNSLVFDLVRWCAIEAELVTLRRRLDDMLRAGPDAAAAKDDDVSSPGVWTEYLDANTNYTYFVNSATGTATWEAPSSYVPLASPIQRVSNDDDRFPVAPAKDDEATAASEKADSRTIDASATIKREQPVVLEAAAVKNDEDRKEQPAEAKHSTRGAVPSKPAAPMLVKSDDTSASLRALRDAKEAEVHDGRAKPPPPLGLPSGVPTWGKRLVPLRKDDSKQQDDQAKEAADASVEPLRQANPFARKAGMVLSPIAMDFLKKRDADLAQPPRSVCVD